MAATESIYYNPKTETLAKDQLRALQLLKLQRLVERSWHHSPFHRRLYEKAGVTPAKIKKIVRQSKFTLRTRRHDPAGTGTCDYYSWVVGPKGHACYFAYSDEGNSAFRIGLAATSKFALRQMEMHDCWLPTRCCFMGQYL